MNEDLDFEFSVLADMVRLRVPYTGSKAKGVRWLEFVLSTAGARRLRDELDRALKATDRTGVKPIPE